MKKKPAKSKKVAKFKKVAKKITPTKIIALSIIGVLGGWLLFGGNHAKANNSTSNKTLTITDHDEFYDYKIENGIWYTRKKNTSNWLEMAASLSPDKYQIAIADLEAFLRSKNITL